MVKYMMIMPQTIKLIDINRKSSVELLVCSSNRKLDKRLIIKAYRNTNNGRILYIADTKDTGPLCIDQYNSKKDGNDIITATIAITIDEFLLL